MLRCENIEKRVDENSPDRIFLFRHCLENGYLDIWKQLYLATILNDILLQIC